VAPPSLHGVRTVTVPPLRRYYGVLRRPASLSPRFVAFAWRYPALRLSFRSRRSSAPNRGPGVGNPVPTTGKLRRETFRTSQVPGEPFCPYALFSDPGRTASTRPVMVPRHGPRYVHNEGSHDKESFGAQWHGLGTHCLRFVRWVAHTGRQTRFRLRAKLCRAGLVTRRVLTKGFRSNRYIPSPFPKLPGARTFIFLDNRWRKR
jgi:hypothetical protein